uniref:Galectin n=1 Tax=Meloidogyne hapla TaxID=6305 RepID=A0A1I8BMU3_MELHA
MADDNQQMISSVPAHYNVALHINPRFDRGIALFSKPDRDIVINSLINNVWGAEQRNSNSLLLEKPFSIRILMLRDYFKISVNGKHLNDFVHRVPLESIKCIFICGCVSIDVIEYQGTKPGSITSCSSEDNSDNICTDETGPIEILKPEIPFIFKLIGGFLPQKEIFLILTPLLNPISFAINLECSDDEYLFHMRIDFPPQNNSSGDRGSVVRNNTAHGGLWQKEERQMGRFPFSPGITADLRIIACLESLKVLIDGCHFCEFYYRSPGPVPTQVNRISVVGDVTIQKFTLKKREG